MTCQILIVDDEASIRDMLVDFLSDEGYHAHAVAHAQEALRICANTKPALLLTDIMMPDIDGWTFAQMLQAQTHEPPIPIIFMSGGSTLSSNVYPHAVFVAKPFDLPDLLSVIESMLNPSNH